MRSLLLLAAAASSLAACSPVEVPAVDASALPDTSDSAGPYAVAARVTARRAIARVELVFHNTAASSPGARVPMEKDAGGVYRASIPGFGAGARVAYHVEAIDSEGDRGAAPPEAIAQSGCGPELCFTVLAR